MALDASLFVVLGCMASYRWLGTVHWHLLPFAPSSMDLFKWFSCGFCVTGGQAGGGCFPILQDVCMLAVYFTTHVPNM